MENRLKPSPLQAAHRRVLLRSHMARANSAKPPRQGAATGVAQEGAQDPEMIPWGQTEESPEPVCVLVADYGELEAEYAAIRRGTGVIDRPDRGLIELTGTDARDLLAANQRLVLPSGFSKRR